MADPDKIQIACKVIIKRAKVRTLRVSSWEAKMDPGMLLDEQLSGLPGEAESLEVRLPFAAWGPGQYIQVLDGFTCLIWE